ncbi:tyrosine-type recombinase/integrase [Bacillus sp. N3536]|nr:tyrosine-type recombinase/integrase [Bacillus sp. N3536]
MNSISEEILVYPSSSIRESLYVMKPFRNWSESTFQSYLCDVNAYERYCLKHKIEPTLDQTKLHLIQKWIREQGEEKVSYATIKRRIASLSSITEFYKDLGVIHSNTFKAISVPVGATEYHSPIMNMKQLIEVHQAIEDLKKENIDVELTIKVLLYTGLRNEAITKLREKNVMYEQELLHHETGIVNSKHKVQLFPLPPRLLILIKEHIQKYQLQPEDSLLFGLKGLSLQNKQLNRITDKICDYLEWKGSARVTPHGFRATIASLLDERGVNVSDIKYLLGHSNNDTVHYYLRRNRHKIERLRLELNQIENEIYEALTNKDFKEERREENISQNISSETKESLKINLSEEEILHLWNTHPKIALKLLEKTLLL